MENPRSKIVKVAGREFVVRPLLAETAEELQLRPPARESKSREGAAVCALVLKRTTPDITEEWLFKNADTSELADVMNALGEVSRAKAAPEGEVKAP